MADLVHLLKLAFGELASGRLPHNDILKPLISKGLGYGILAGSTMVKVPQLLNVVRARSAAGLSPLSFELETVGLLIAVTYGFLLGLPFSAFGETVALLVQNNLLLLLVYRYQRRSLGRTLGLLALLGGSGYSVAVGRVSKALITRAYDAQNAIIVASRLPQILANFRARGTGQLSLITYGLNTAGAAARIFTSIQEQAGAAMVRGSAIAALLNAILALQIVFYGGGGAAKNAGRRGKKKRT